MIFLRVPGDILDNTLLISFKFFCKEEFSKCLLCEKNGYYSFAVTSTTFFYRKTRNKFPQGKKLLFYAAKGFKPLIMFGCRERYPNVLNRKRPASCI